MGRGIITTSRTACGRAEQEVSSCMASCRLRNVVVEKGKKSILEVGHLLLPVSRYSNLQFT